jgi:hypothetical protein
MTVPRLHHAMSLKRFIIVSLCMLPFLFALYVVVDSWSAEWMPQDPPPPSCWAVFMWLVKLVFWPFFFSDLIFPDGLTDLALLVVLLITGLFWGFVVELIFMVKARLWPVTALEPTGTAPVSSTTGLQP